MWFSNIRVRAFGPLHSDKGDQLQFTSGLNVVHGPNETGKSSWHAALAAALCGRRRGPGRTVDDATFAERHRPWSSGEDGPWGVGAEMVRDDGTRVRFDRDFRLNETEVCDPELGDRRLVDLESEITHDGSPDGALLVGLNRSTFAMAASVRQAGVVSDLENPDALQEQLARAAAGSDDATAARALERIESFRREHVGRKRRGGIRPLQKAIEAEDRACSELDAVRGRHDEYLDDMATADRLREAVGGLEQERDRVRGGDAPELADVTLLAQAMSKAEATGDPARTSPEPAERIAQLDARMQSFLPAPEFDQVQQWVAPLRRLGAQHGAGEPAHQTPGSSRRLWKPAVAVAVVGLLSAIAAGVVAGPVTAVGIGAATGVAVLVLVMRRGAPEVSDQAEPTITAETRVALAKLDEAKLPHDADAAVSIAVQRREELGGQQRCRDAAFDKLVARVQSAADRAAGKLEGVDLASVDIAAAEAAVDETRAEHERVLRLDETLTATARFMQEAADNTHRVLAPRIESVMGALVSRVTDGRYTGVRVDPADLGVRLITRSGDRRDARDVSRGTTEQVYLALRVVLAEVLSTGRERCPLLLDDATVHADSDRKAAILECLYEVARERQVILFSQEQQVLEWARSRLDDGVHLIELGPAQPA